MRYPVSTPDSQRGLGRDKAYQEDGSKVDFGTQKKHQSLSLGISKADVVLENLWPSLSEHEPGEEQADEGEP